MLVTVFWHQRVKTRDATGYMYHLYFRNMGIQAIDAYIDTKMIHSYSVDNNLWLKNNPGDIKSATVR